MKLFSWMQSKFRDTRANSHPHIDQESKETPNEEFKDWPNGLLAIGTFGYTDHACRDEPTSQLVERSLDNEIPREEESSTPNFSEFTAEEVRSLQKELTKLLRQKSGSSSKAEETTADLPLDKFLNCPSSSEVDLDSDIDRTIRIILGRCKDVKKRAIGKKSLYFILKKMFVCRSGFASTPSLRETFQESRMEKLMRAMLTIKIYPHNSYGASSPTKKCIEDYRHTQNAENRENMKEKNRDGFKWDKTGSEFIILEIYPT